MSASAARGLYWFGVLLMLFGVADALLSRLANIDLTGVTWSPIVAGGLGIVLTWVARLGPSEDA
jgi:hypothetical protein